MSRTYRNSNEYWNSKELQKEIEEVKERIENGIAYSWDFYVYKYHSYKYKADKHNNTSLPRSHRKMVNRTRRAKDKQEVYKAVTIFDYEEQCSKWNCKDNDSWGYY